VGIKSRDVYGSRIIVRLSEMPLTREKCLVASLFQNRGQGPFSCGQSAPLSLKSHRGHAAPVGNAAGLDRCPTRCATRLSIEGEERHALRCKTINIWCGHSAVRSPAINSGVTITEVIGKNKNDIGFGSGLLLFRKAEYF